MENAVRKQTAFRLDENLLNRLKINAKKEHRSLNNYVELVLMNVAFDEPNDVTIAAMEESEKSDNLETLDLEHFKEFVETL